MCIESKTCKCCGTLIPTTKKEKSNKEKNRASYRSTKQMGDLLSYS